MTFKKKTHEESHAKVAPPHLHSNREADHDVNLAERVAALEKDLAALKQDLADHKQNLTDSGIRLIR